MVRIFGTLAIRVTIFRHPLGPISPTWNRLRTLLVATAVRTGELVHVLWNLLKILRPFRQHIVSILGRDLRVVWMVVCRVLAAVSLVL